MDMKLYRKLKKKTREMEQYKEQAIHILMFFVSEKPKLPDNFQALTWDKLAESVQAIHTSRSIKSSLEELYQAVENMCSHKMSAALYDQLKQICEHHVKSNITQFLEYPLSAITILDRNTSNS